MRVLVVGSGAREHALCWKIARSPLLSELIASPGNPGIATVAECLSFATMDLDGIVRVALERSIDLAVIGPEDPLAVGLADRLQSAGVSTFGPSQAAATIEASKAFAKDLMARSRIPTARYEVVSTRSEAIEALDRWGTPLVIKADGLARGRGVSVARTREAAEAAIQACLVEGVFGASGSKVVFEEFLEGEEISLIALSDGERVLHLQPAEDHKQLLDGDSGPNTGGMGAFSPVPALTPSLRSECENLVERAIGAMGAEGRPFRGALFAGFILTERGPRVLEFNARFGDPETEVLLPRLESDLLPLLQQCAAGRLETTSVRWNEKAAVCVVLASGGYPGSFQSSLAIEGLEGAAREDVVVFHAGTGVRNGRLVTAGGRVLAVTALGPDLDAARSRAYQAADAITFDGVYRRSDIGRRSEPARR